MLFSYPIKDADCEPEKPADKAGEACSDEISIHLFIVYFTTSYLMLFHMFHCYLLLNVVYIIMNHCLGL